MTISKKLKFRQYEYTASYQKQLKSKLVSTSKSYQPKQKSRIETQIPKQKFKVFRRKIKVSPTYQKQKPSRLSIKVSSAYPKQKPLTSYPKKYIEKIYALKKRDIEIEKEYAEIQKYKPTTKEPLDVKKACGFNYSSQKFDGYEHSIKLDIYFDNDIIEDLTQKELNEIYEFLWKKRMSLNRYHHCVRRLHFIRFTYDLFADGNVSERHMSTHITSFYELKDEMIRTILNIINSIRSENYDIKWIKLAQLTGIAVNYHGQYQSFTGQ